MNYIKLLKRITAVILAFVFMANCFVSYAENRKIETAEQEHYTKTFKCNTKGGTLYIKDIEGNVLKKLKKGDKILYGYPDNKSPSEIYIEAVADEGYVVESYLASWLLDGKKIDTCESVYDMKEKIYSRGHFLKSAQFDEFFSVSFVEEKKANDNLITETVSSLLSTPEPNIDNPKVGDTYTGKGTVTYNGKKTETYNGTGYITCTSGVFKGDDINLKTCASGHDYYAPVTGQTGTYTITISSINKATGKVTCTVMWSNSKHAEGYQHLSGTFSYYHSFDGTFTIYKEMGETAGSFVLTNSFKSNLDLSATFEMYSDNECKKKVATLKTDKTGAYVKQTLSLDAGTYYVKETIPPKGFSLNPAIFLVNIGAGSSRSLTVKDNVLRAKISGVKIDSRTGKSVPTLGLSLAGAVYTIYEDEACTKECNEGISRADGTIEFDIEYLGYGTYYIKETKAPYGYYADPTGYRFSLWLVVFFMYFHFSYIDSIL